MARFWDENGRREENNRIAKEIKDLTEKYESEIKELKEELSTIEDSRNFINEHLEEMIKIKSKRAIVINVESYAASLLSVALLAFVFPFLFRNLPSGEVKNFFLLILATSFGIFISIGSITLIKKKKGNIGEILALILIGISFGFFIFQQFFIK